ncbi:MAG TPA: rhodanese-like domain-containing protein [Verrucomicrobiae bacterium]|nr:rhodanese-like domain-containing protein [Verrucomicrobiae bacterium]
MTMWRGGGRLAAAALMSTILGVPAHAAGTFPTVGPAQVAGWQEKGESFLFVDTRARTLFELKHARGAINIPAFALKSKPLPRAARVVLYDGGAGSPDAPAAAAALQSAGQPEFYVLEGGLSAWEAQGLPIVVQTGPAVAPLVDPIGVEDLLRAIDAGTRVAILDIRPADLFAQSRVPGAKPASTEEQMNGALASLSPADLVVLYDDGGGEARDRAEQLRRRGFRAARYLYGGMVAWRQKNLRVER